MTYIDAVTLSIAVLGAALGLINTWNNINVNRVKLAVRPAHAFMPGRNATLDFCVEVSNRSAFPVTISEVGFEAPGGNDRFLIHPVIFDGSSFPTRLEARDSVMYYVQAPRKTPRKIQSAYVITACGEKRKGTSGALKQIASEAFHAEVGRVDFQRARD